MTLPDYLQFLGISFNANPEEIKTAYRKLSKKFHSGRNGDELFEGKLSRYWRLMRYF